MDPVDSEVTTSFVKAFLEGLAEDSPESRLASLRALKFEAFGPEVAKRLEEMEKDARENVPTSVLRELDKRRDESKRIFKRIQRLSKSPWERKDKYITRKGDD